MDSAVGWSPTGLEGENRYTLSMIIIITITKKEDQLRGFILSNYKSAINVC